MFFLFFITWGSRNRNGFLFAYSIYICFFHLFFSSLKRSSPINFFPSFISSIFVSFIYYFFLNFRTAPPRYISSSLIPAIFVSFIYSFSNFKRQRPQKYLFVYFIDVFFFPSSIFVLTLRGRDRKKISYFIYICFFNLFSSFKRTWPLGLFSCFTSSIFIYFIYYILRSWRTPSHVFFVYFIYVSFICSFFFYSRTWPLIFFSVHFIYICYVFFLSLFLKLLKNAIIRFLFVYFIIVSFTGSLLTRERDHFFFSSFTLCIFVMFIYYFFIIS